jgi:hypothetical protein
MSRKWKCGRLIPNDKEKEMYKMVERGDSFSDVAIRYGLTRERVRQIFKECYGMTAKECARYKNSTAKKIELTLLDREDARKRKEEKHSKMFGCAEDVLTAINGKVFSTAKLDYSTPAWKYLNQKRNAEHREITWNITFPEWWRAWQESGKYHLRGRGKGYCMARFGDSGAYEPGNIYICTVGQNFSDMYLVREKKSHCNKGHSKTPENTSKASACKECARIRAKEKYWRDKSAQLQATA